MTVASRSSLPLPPIVPSACTASSRPACQSRAIQRESVPRVEQLVLRSAASITTDTIHDWLKVEQFVAPSAASGMAREGGSQDPTTAQSIFVCTTLGADAYELPKLTRRGDGDGELAEKEDYNVNYQITIRKTLSTFLAPATRSRVRAFGICTRYSLVIDAATGP